MKILTSFGMIACLVFNIVAFGSAQETDDETDLRPISNADFFGVPSVGKITQRFEIYDPHSRTELETVKRWGFDQVILDRAPLHKDATDVGLDVVIANWWTHETPAQQIDDTLQLARTVAPGQLVGISLMDEPERNSPDTPFGFYIDLYERIKPKMVDGLQGVRLEIAYWGPLRYWDQRYYDYFSFLYEAADVMRIMPYPDLHEDPLGEVYLMLQRSKRAMALADRDLPHVVILQTWVLPPENKLPTIDELRVMAYQAMLGGAETLSFFEYRPEVWNETPGFSDAFQELMQDLTALRRRYAAATLESTLEENGILEVSARFPSGRLERVRVNTNRFEEDGMQALEIQDSSLSRESVPDALALACPPLDSVPCPAPAKINDCCCRQTAMVSSKPGTGMSPKFFRPRKSSVMGSLGFLPRRNR